MILGSAFLQLWKTESVIYTKGSFKGAVNCTRIIEVH